MVGAVSSAQGNMKVGDARDKAAQHFASQGNRRTATSRGCFLTGDATTPAFVRLETMASSATSVIRTVV